MIEPIKIWTKQIDIKSDVSGSWMLGTFDKRCTQKFRSKCTLYLKLHEYSIMIALKGRENESISSVIVIFSECYPKLYVTNQWWKWRNEKKLSKLLTKLVNDGIKDFERAK